MDACGFTFAAAHPMFMRLSYGFGSFLTAESACSAEPSVNTIEGSALQEGWQAIQDESLSCASPTLR